MTANEEVNSISSLHFKHILGTENVYQLPSSTEVSDSGSISLRLGGRDLFGKEVNFNYLTLRFSTGASIVGLKVSDVSALMKKMDVIVPLFLIKGAGEDKELVIWTTDNPPTLQTGTTLIGANRPGR